MDQLSHVVGDRLSVECATFRRRGSYRVAGLVERYGGDVSHGHLLRLLTASCRFQRAPGDAAARKYEAGCSARLNLPKPPDLEPPAPPGRPFTVEVWDERGRVEMRLAVIYPLDGALAAFEAAASAYPRSLITLRQGIRVVRQRERLKT